MIDGFRLMVFSPQDEFQFEFSPREVLKCRFVEEINKEHSLSIVTTRTLKKSQRLLTQDAMSKWREFVVTGCDDRHENGERPFGEYHCVWSLQHDLGLLKVDAVPGLESDPVSATYALGVVLGGTRRWNVGTVTQMTYAGADMSQTNGWTALTSLVEAWGGEVDARITVDNQRIVSRHVELLEHIGTDSPTRRFDYTKDLIGMSRHVDDTPFACRIRPYGKSEKTIDGFGVKLTIESVNDGLDYLQNDDVVELVKLPDGIGGWEYPTIDVENSKMEDPLDLLEWAESVLVESTTPKVTYEASVVQFAVAGMDPKGVALGDVVQCVDRGFSDDGVRVQTRVRRIEWDVCDANNTNLTLGDVSESYLMTVSNAVTKISSDVTNLAAVSVSTSDYLNHLIEHLNEQINASGGYTYITRGQGMRTYDVEVSDPLVGSEASSVVEVKGGTIRIANSRTQSGDWDWKTVFTSGTIAAELVTAANIVTGFIGNADNGSFWNLDTGTLRIGIGDTLGNKTVETALSEFSEMSQTVTDIATNVSGMRQELEEDIDDARRFATDYLLYENGELTLGATDSVIKNVMTNQRMKFVTDNGDVAWFGLNEQGIWELYIETASILNRLNFNAFAWIARQNGNMTLKWAGV